MNKKNVFEFLTDLAKLVSFISLVMTVVIKTRVLLGLPVGDELAKNRERQLTEEKEEAKNEG